eukprot:TRINITY_DN5434_c0_g1_i1.p1 TRINITY_DN5434_c0_g1~~TRINITY_DN5434_c0_g1_i1.p1  ORF type:complete len:1037 (-),score=215.33 TRINITY_DN5434_c0_g1_i1:40-2835(-)
MLEGHVDLVAENKKLRKEVEKMKTQLEVYQADISFKTVSNSYEKSMKKEPGISLLKTPAGIDIPTTLICENWSLEVLLQTLEFSDLQRYVDVFTAPVDTPYPIDEFDIFEFDTNTLKLVNAAPSQLFELVLIPKASILRSCFNYQKFITELIYTITLYSSEVELVEYLIEKYRSLSHQLSGLDYQLKKTIINFLNEMVHFDNGFYFKHNTELHDLVKEAFEDYPDDLRKERRHLVESLPKLTTPNVTLAPFEVNLSTEIKEITSINPSTFAEQLTVMSYTFFKKVQIVELLNAQWIGNATYEQCPNVARLVSFSNRVSSLIETFILKAGTNRQAADMIIYFIQVSMRLYQLHNYDGLMSVVYALQSASVQKLKMSWSFVPKKEKEIFDTYSSLLDGLGHYKGYTKEIRTVPSSEACVPVFAFNCENITKLHEAVNTHKNEIVNWNKISTLTDILLKMYRFKGKYEFETIPEIQNIIMYSELWTCENSNWEIAVMKEKLASDFTEFKTDDLWAVTSLSERDWTFIFTGSIKPVYEDREWILREGELTNHLFKILEGNVNVEIGESINSLQAGDFFDVMSIIGESCLLNYISDGFTKVASVSFHTMLETINNDQRILRYLNYEFAINLAKQLNILNEEKKSELSRYERIKKRKESRKNDDEKLTKIFGLEDVVVRSLNCHIKYSSHSSSGTLFITQNYLCFKASGFGSKFKTVIPFSTLDECNKTGNKIKIVSDKKKKYTFSDIDNLNAVYSTVSNILQSTDRSVSLTRSVSVQSVKSEFEVYETLTDEEWQIIIKGTKNSKFEAGEVIIEKGQKIRGLYHVIEGICMVETKEPCNNYVVDGGTLAEWQFLSGDTSSFEVIAGQGGATIRIIEAYYLNIVFQYYPELAGKFYFYMSKVIADKIKYKAETMNPKDQESPEITHVQINRNKESQN